MELSPEDQAVLGIYRKHNLATNQYLPLGLLHKEKQHLPRSVRKNWDSIITRLRISGYLVLDPLGYGLTHKAHDYIRRCTESKNVPAECHNE